MLSNLGITAFIFLNFVKPTPIPIGRKLSPGNRRLESNGNIMIGLIFCIIAGSAMSIQGVMNTRLSEKIGLYESNVIVQGVAFILSLAALYILGKGNFREISNVNKWYLFGGALGIIITITVMLGIGKLSPTVAISVILISQLLVAALIDAFGIMGTEKAPFLWNKYIGCALMVGGVLLFKIK